MLEIREQRDPGDRGQVRNSFDVLSDDVNWSMERVLTILDFDRFEEALQSMGQSPAKSSGTVSRFIHCQIVRLVRGMFGKFVKSKMSDSAANCIFYSEASLFKKRK
jgi:hypothetical protein